MEAAVPQGMSSGSSFMAVYRLRQAAKNAALLHLSEHVVDTKDLECAPEDCKECCICLEDYVIGDMQAFLPCFHRFHSACAKGSLSESRRCPMCNQDFHSAAFDARQLLDNEPSGSSAPAPTRRSDGKQSASCTCSIS